MLVCAIAGCGASFVLQNFVARAGERSACRQSATALCNSKTLKGVTATLAPLAQFFQPPLMSLVCGSRSNAPTITRLEERTPTVQEVRTQTVTSF